MSTPQDWTRTLNAAFPPVTEPMIQFEQIKPKPVKKPKGGKK